MSKKLTAAVVAGAAVFTGIAATPANADTVNVADARVSAESQTPVPGAMTVGRVVIGNNASAQGVLPAGTTFEVKFERLQGEKRTGVATLTTWYSGHVKINRINDDTFKVVLTRDFAPGQQVPLDWSKAHWFDYSTRDKITVTLDTLPQGTVDRNEADNTASYDNRGYGF